MQKIIVTTSPIFTTPGGMSFQGVDAQGMAENAAVRESVVTQIIKRLEDQKYLPSLSTSEKDALTSFLWDNAQEIRTILNDAFASTVEIKQA